MITRDWVITGTQPAGLSCLMWIVSSAVLGAGGRIATSLFVDLHGATYARCALWPKGQSTAAVALLLCAAVHVALLPLLLRLGVPAGCHAPHVETWTSRCACAAALGAQLGCAPTLSSRGMRIPLQPALLWVTCIAVCRIAALAVCVVW